MMNEKLEKAFNDQINAEFYSEYLYLSMLAYFERLNLQGFKNWMDVQRQEEHAHAMGLFNYVHERGAKVTLQPIAQPETEWESPLAVFEAVSAAICAANGVLFLEPLKPNSPALAHDIAFPTSSVIVTIVLLKVE